MKTKKNMKTSKMKTSKMKKKIHNTSIKNKDTEKTPFPIDIVYTWKGENDSNDMRLRYNNELKYSLRSIELFAPWVNKIFILMNNYNPPSWIKDNDKIIIVEHSETFPSADYLPNTNSNAIETTISNIKDLSEHYIYFNDDFFLGRKTKYTSFFTPDGKAIVDDYVLITRDIVKDKNTLGIKFPQNSDSMYKHIPIPQIKSLVQKFNKKYADYIDWIRKIKKRNEKGFDICRKYNLNAPCQQIHYPVAKYMYSKKKAVLVNNNHINNKNVWYVSSADITLKPKLLTELLDVKPTLFCINDSEEDIKKRKIILKKLLIFFNKYYPNKASFEK